jgi:hypothetical protein
MIKQESLDSHQDGHDHQDDQEDLEEDLKQALQMILKKMILIPMKTKVTIPLFLTLKYFQQHLSWQFETQ